LQCFGVVSAFCFGVFCEIINVYAVCFGVSAFDPFFFYGPVEGRLAEVGRPDGDTLTLKLYVLTKE